MTSPVVGDGVCVGLPGRWSRRTEGRGRIIEGGIDTETTLGVIPVKRQNVAVNPAVGLYGRLAGSFLQVASLGVQSIKDANLLSGVGSKHIEAVWEGYVT